MYIFGIGDTGQFDLRAGFYSVCGTFDALVHHFIQSLPSLLFFLFTLALCDIEVEATLKRFCEIKLEINIHDVQVTKQGATNRRVVCFC